MKKKTNTTSKNFYDIKIKLCFAFDFAPSSSSSYFFCYLWYPTKLESSLSHIKKYNINEWMRRINLHNNFHFHDEDFFFVSCEFTLCFCSFGSARRFVKKYKIFVVCWNQLNWLSMVVNWKKRKIEQKCVYKWREEEKRNVLNIYSVEWWSCCSTSYPKRHTMDMEYIWSCDKW